MPTRKHLSSALPPDAAGSIQRETPEDEEESTRPITVDLRVSRGWNVYGPWDRPSEAA